MHNIKQRLATLAVALLASIGMVAVAAPVDAAVPQVCQTIVADDNTVESQTCVPEKTKKAELARWGYCSPNWYNGKMWFWDNQGYCGSGVAMNYPTGNQCRSMGQWDNWAGSGYNLSTRDLYLWNAGNCTGLSGYVYLLNGSAIPDMYALQLGNAVSSISLISTGCPEC
jgi:hypothetical protein